MLDIRQSVLDGAVGGAVLHAALPVLAPALALDILVGDPVSRWHPVALFGRGVQYLVDRAPREGAAWCLAYGAFLVAGTVAGVALASGLLLRGLEALSPLAATLGGAALLKVSFSYRQMEVEAFRVARELEGGQWEGAGLALRALVARDTRALSPALMASAAVESIAENLNDSLVAPLFYYLLFGVPGALAYRAINTLDAMVGYHGAFEHLGKVAARLDDGANWLPARGTAGLLIAAAALAGSDARRATRVAARDHGRPESPNAGWPMAAMAGALGVQLEKVGHYRLGDRAVDLTPATIRQAVRVARWTAVLAATLALAVAAV